LAIRAFDNDRFETEGFDKVQSSVLLPALVAGIGQGNDSGSVLIRTIKHPAAHFITEENINEKIIMDIIADIFRKQYDNLWFKSS